MYFTATSEQAGKASITDVALHDDDMALSPKWGRRDMTFQNDISGASSVVSTLKFNKRRSSEGISSISSLKFSTLFVSIGI